LLVFLLVLLIEFSELKSLWLQYIWDPAMIKLTALGANKTAMIILVGGIIFFFLLIFVLRKKNKRFFFRESLEKFLGGFKNGILAVRKVSKTGWLFFIRCFIWTGYLFSLYVCFFCFPETASLSLNTALILLLFGTFSVSYLHPAESGLTRLL